MKARRLLSLCTACAVVATIGSSYALWDKDNDSKTTSLTIGQTMQVAVAKAEFAADAKPLAPTGSFDVDHGTATDSLSGDVQVTVTNDLAGKAQLTLTAENFTVGAEKTPMSADAQKAIQVKFTEKDGTTITDDSVDSELTGTNEYKVIVTLDDSKITGDTAKTVIDELAGKTIGFDVKAVASAKAAV